MRSPSRGIKQCLVVGLGLVAGAMTVAGGGNGIALVDNTPTFSEASFIAMTGRIPKVWPDTSMNCLQNGNAVMHQKKVADGGGAWFTFGPTASWTSGGASCTARLITYDHKGNPKVQDQLTFWVSG